MSGLWKVHKRFMTTVGIGGLFFLVYYFWFLAGFDADANLIREKRNFEIQKLKSLLAQGDPEEGTVQRAKADVDRANDSLKGLIEDLRFDVPDKYKPSGSDTKKKHFGSMKISVYSELREKSVKNNIDPEAVKDLGFGILGKEYGEDVADEVLIRLAITEHVWRMIIDKIGAEGGKIVTVDPMANNPEPDKSIVVKKKFVTSVEIRFVFHADSKCVFSVLHGLQRPKKYLSLLKLNTVRKDPTRDLLECEMTVGALVVDPEGSLQDPGEEEEDDWDN